jgi:hypothetical protein
VFVAQQTYDPASHLCSAIRLPPAIVKGKSQPIQVFSVRGILLDDRAMLLTLPVKVRITPSDLCCSGFLTRWQLSSSLLSLCVPSDVVCAIGDRCHCEFDCPELARPITLNAVMQDIEESGQESTQCKTLILGSIEGSDALAFFKPGSLIQSHKTWDEMARH